MNELINHGQFTLLNTHQVHYDGHGQVHFFKHPQKFNNNSTGRFTLAEHYLKLLDSELPWQVGWARALHSVCN
jgi:hypothetical protein